MKNKLFKLDLHKIIYNANIYIQTYPLCDASSSSWTCAFRWSSSLRWWIAIEERGHTRHIERSEPKNITRNKKKGRTIEVKRHKVV